MESLCIFYDKSLARASSVVEKDNKDGQMRASTCSSGLPFPTPVLVQESGALDVGQSRVED
jgi:hypothetical protein